jgi:hypothetical protein
MEWSVADAEFVFPFCFWIHRIDFNWSGDETNPVLAEKGCILLSLAVEQVDEVGSLPGSKG